MSDLAIRVRALFRRRAVEAELDDELRFHLEQSVAKHMRAGCSRQEAERLTRLAFGGLDQVKDSCRQARGIDALETLLRDLAHGLKMLRSQPTFSTVAVLTLAIGIGANTALFSVVDGVLFKPLPFPRPERLVALDESKPNFARGSISYPNFRDWQRDNRSFSALAVSRPTGFSLTGRGNAEQLNARLVTADFLPLLGIKPLLGRGFAHGEDEIGAAPTVLVGEDLWRRKLGASPHALSEGLTLDGRAFPIIGVLPARVSRDVPGFSGVDLVVPVGQWSNPLLPDRRAGLGFHGVGRLRPGVTLEQARADMERVTRGLAAAYPDADTGIGASLRPYKEMVVGQVRPLLLVLLGAVGFVLLIACVNVATLLLARASGRAGELAVRAALGASRGRLVQQLLTESVLLAVLGGGLGLLIAAWGTRAALGLLPAALPRADAVAIDARVLAFTLAASLASGVLFGLAPALRLSRAGCHETLKQGGRGASGARHRAQDAFVMVEMATALILLVGAGLMLRSLGNLWRVDPGFRPDGVVVANVTLPPAAMKAGPAAARASWRALEARLAAVPGLAAWSLSWAAVPLVTEDDVQFWIEGRPRPASENEMGWSLKYVVGPRYLQALRIPLRRGRFFDEHDDEHGPPVAVIDEVFARQYFGGRDPLHQRLNLNFGASGVEIVGVTGHVKQWGLDTDDLQPLRAQVYLPFPQLPDTAMALTPTGAQLLLRGEARVPGVFEEVRRVLQAMSSEQELYGEQTLNDAIRDSLAARRFSMILLGCFALVALLLASIGLSGVTAYLVGQKTHELGVRIALGARRGDVLRLVLARSVRAALAGTALGIAAALPLTRLMGNLLYGVSATDPTTFAGVVVVLVAVTLAASYLPARRAMGIAPASALSDGGRLAR